MAKPLLNNHNTNHHNNDNNSNDHHHHPLPLITLGKETNGVQLRQHSQELVASPRLLFTPTVAISTPTSTLAATATSKGTIQTQIQSSKQTATNTTTTPATSNQDHVKSTGQQAILPIPSARISTYSHKIAATSFANRKQQQQQQHNLSRTPTLVSTNPLRPHNQLRRRSSSNATTEAGGKQTTKLNNRQSSGSVINQSAVASTIAATATAAAAAAASISGTSSETGNVTARLLDMGKRLLDAAREGQIDHVRQLVVSSGAPFTSDWLGTTALHLAAQYGHAEIADILLRGGVNRDARTKLERTALHLAAQSGSLPVVESLLIHGSDINARDMLKMTPLHWAVERRHIDIVKRLLVGGANINVKSKFQLTPLEIAQNSGYYEIVELFKNWPDKDDCDLGAYDDDDDYEGNNNINSNSNNNNDNSNNNNTTQHNQVNNINRFYESHDILNDVNYQLLMVENNTGGSRGTSMLDIDEPCIDLVELEWNSLKFEADFLHPLPLPLPLPPISHNHDNDDIELDNIRNEQKPCEIECLMKMVEELQKENEQLRRRLEQVSTPMDELR